MKLAFICTDFMVPLESFTYSCSSGMWEWQGDDYSMKRTPGHGCAFYGLPNSAGFSHLFWDELCHCQDDLLNMLDEHIPIKDCAD